MVNYILIAEDDEDDQFLIESTFKEIAKDVVIKFVNNGVELINYFNNFDSGDIDKLPNLLIVDLNMPKKNGKEAISELIGRDYFKKFPTIIFSTTDCPIEKKKCIDLGINDFYVKPISHNKLVDLLCIFKNIAKI